MLKSTSFRQVLSSLIVYLQIEQTMTSILDTLLQFTL